MSKRNKPHDNIYRERRDHIVDFAFDKKTAGVFTDMIRRSVPGYETMIPLSGLIGAQFLRDKTRAYDLGCSLGASTLALLSHAGQTDCEILAVDNSEAMLDKARSERDWDPRVSFINADLREIEFKNASLILMNFSLQFINPNERLKLLIKIHDSLKPGGALILSEKVAADTLMVSLHENYKQANGYSELEISQKRTALERVLRPDSIENHEARLRAAGFDTIHNWYRCLNWASFLAIA